MTRMDFRFEYVGLMKPCFIYIPGSYREKCLYQRHLPAFVVTAGTGGGYL